MFLKTKLTDPRKRLGTSRVQDPKSLVNALNKMWDCLDEIYDYLGELDRTLATKFNDVPLSDMTVRDRKEFMDSTSNKEVEDLRKQLENLKNTVHSMGGDIRELRHRR